MISMMMMMRTAPQLAIDWCCFDSGLDSDLSAAHNCSELILMKMINDDDDDDGDDDDDDDDDWTVISWLNICTQAFALIVMQMMMMILMMILMMVIFMVLMIWNMVITD